MKTIAELDTRLDRIEKLLERLVSIPSHNTVDIASEIAMVRAQGKDVATYFKEKGKAKIRLDRQSRKRA